MVPPRGAIARLRRLVRASPVFRKAAAWLLLCASAARTLATPSSAAAWASRARAHRRLGHTYRSIRASERGLAIDPSSVDLAELSASLLSGLGDSDGARRVWADLVAADRGSLTRSVILGLLRIGADALLLTYVRGRPTEFHDDRADLCAAAAQILVGDEVSPSELIEASQRVQDPELRHAIVTRLVAAGVPGAAWQVASVAPTPLRAVTRRELVEGLASAAELDALAVTASQQADSGILDAQAAGIVQDALVDRGRAAYRARDGEAVRWFNAAARLGSRRDILLWAARAHHRVGDLAAARAAAEAALDCAPDWPPALLVLAGILERSGDASSAVTLWRQVIADREATRDHLEKACEGLTRAGDEEAASLAATRVVALAPDDPDARVLRAITEFARGNVEHVASEVSALEERADAAAKRALVHLLVQCGDPMRAVEHLRRLGDVDQRADLWAETLQGLRTDGYLDRAVGVAEEAAARFPTDARLGRLAASCTSEFEVVSGNWRADVGGPRRVTAQPSRVLHVVGRSAPYWRKGYTVRTQHVVTAQRQSGLDAQVVTQLGFPWSLGHDVPLLENIDGVPHHRLPLPTDAPRPVHLAERLSLNAEALADLVERVRPAGLHAASDFRNALIALEVGAAFDIPVIYEVRGFWEETWLADRNDVGEDRAWYRLRREREMESARRAAHVITLAGPMKDHLVANGVPADQVSLVPNAVEPAAFAEVRRDAVLARSLSLREDEIVAGYVSSLNRYEGIDVLLEAIASVRRTGIPMRGLVVGDGDERQRLERHAAALGIGDMVTFTGHVPHQDVAPYYGLIDIFVVPRLDSRVGRLVSPLKPYEAMAAGRTVVVSGTPVLETIVAEGETGATFAPGDSADLARQLAELARDAERREQMGRAAREFVLREHTWEKSTQRYRAVYAQLGMV